MIKDVNGNKLIETEEYKPSEQLDNTLKEVDYMMKHPEEYKAYSSVEELFEDLDNNDCLLVIQNCFNKLGAVIKVFYFITVLCL